MQQWVTIRSTQGWQLQRNRDGLARVVAPYGAPGPTTSFSQALIDYKTSSKHGVSTHGQIRVLFVHGMLGEYEAFPETSAALSKHGCHLEFFRYRSNGSHFGHYARALRLSIKQQSVGAKTLCVIGHSFGCRLIAAALQDADLKQLDIVFFAPPTGIVRWAKIGASIAPVRWLLGGSLEEMATNRINEKSLKHHRLLVLEGSSRNSGDGWLASHETQINTAHQRVRIPAGHSRLPSHDQAHQEIERFLGF